MNHFIPVLGDLRVGVVLPLEHVHGVVHVGNAGVVQEGLHGARGLGDVGPVTGDGGHGRSAQFLGGRAIILLFST